MRVLHIVNWYPNARDPHEAPFIRRHVLAMQRTCECEVWHVAVRHHARWSLLAQSLDAKRTLVLYSPLRSGFIIEWVTTLMVLWMWLARNRSRHHEVVNFYIAYPLCTHLRLLRAFIRRPMMMMEQWSGYRYDLFSTSGGVDRARRIFHHQVPVVCVSQSLANDIRRFSGSADLPCPVVPNVVEVEHFTGGSGPARTPDVYFAMAYWRKPKRPEVMIEALAVLRARGVLAQLRLAGDGPEMPAVKALIGELGLQEHVTLLGRLDAAAAAMEMREAFALWHCSDYETFSVVCAEALCCGTPVIASNVGGIPSFVNATNGLLVNANDPAAWAAAVVAGRERIMAMDRQAMSHRASERFSAERVGRQLVHLFEERMRGRTPGGAS